jgi:hypothetical protein
MLITSQSLGILTISLAYAELILRSTSLASGYLNTYATTYEQIVYVFSIF